MLIESYLGNSKMGYNIKRNEGHINYLFEIFASKIISNINRNVRAKLFKKK